MILEIFLSVSLQLSLPPNLLSSMCWVESKHQTESINYHDGKGHSIGVCQIKLSTAKEMGFKGTQKELLDPKNNIYFAGKYLKTCYNKYKNWSRAITCYNKGHSSSHGGSEYLAKVMNRLLTVTPIKVEEK